jgi:hypothetical protein
MRLPALIYRSGDNMLNGHGGYRDILRVIGRLLDEREAVLRAEEIDPVDEFDAAISGKQLFVGYEDVEIVEHEAFMRVSWRTRGGSAARHAYTELSISKLRARARQLRGERAEDPGGDWEELLRTLGQELDAEELRVSGIFEKENEFFVSGSAAGRYVTRSFLRDELVTLSQHRQQLRSAPDRESPMPAMEEPVGAAQRSSWLLWKGAIAR